MQKSLCNPNCINFFCTKKALKRMEGSKAYCLWLQDECMGYQCKYAACKVHALLPNGVCNLKTGHTIKKQTGKQKENYNQLEIKAKEILRRKIRGISEEDLFY